jgi:hypothetical protein
MPYVACKQFVTEHYCHILFKPNRPAGYSPRKMFFFDCLNKLWSLKTSWTTHPMTWHHVPRDSHPQGMLLNLRTYATGNFSFTAWQKHLLKADSVPSQNTPTSYPSSCRKIQLWSKLRQTIPIEKNRQERMLLWYLQHHKMCWQGTSLTQFLSVCDVFFLFVSLSYVNWL